MTAIRVVVSDLPAMLAEVLGDFLSAEHDIEVVAHASESTLPALMRDTNAQVVVLGSPESRSSSTTDWLLERFPRVSILCISADAREATRLRLVREEKSLPEVSPQQIADSIREAVATAPETVRRPADG